MNCQDTALSLALPPISSLGKAVARSEKIMSVPEVTPLPPSPLSERPMLITQHDSFMGALNNSPKSPSLPPPPHHLCKAHGTHKTDIPAPEESASSVILQSSASLCGNKKALLRDTESVSHNVPMVCEQDAAVCIP